MSIPKFTPFSTNEYRILNNRPQSMLINPYLSENNDPIVPNIVYVFPLF